MAETNNFQCNTTKLSVVSLSETPTQTNSNYSLTNQVSEVILCLARWDGLAGNVCVAWTYVPSSSSPTGTATSAPRRSITSRNICAVCKTPPRSSIARVCIRRNVVLCVVEEVVVAALVRRLDVVRVAVAWEDEDTRRTPVVRRRQEARAALVRAAIIFLLVFIDNNTAVYNLNTFPTKD
eukprot:scaffold2791_cov154-Amphora_coffeaeformis.AAC.13